MWVYKPTGQKFETRKDAKNILGNRFAQGAIKYGDLIFINDSTFANNGNTIYTNTERV